MQEIQANTAIKVKVGPFVDVSDCFTPETGITLGAADEAELFKHDAAAVTDISGNTWAAIGSCDGWYNLTLSTTDTNTEGLLDVIVQDDSVCLPVHCRFMVLAQATWISKYTAKDTGYMDVDAKAISGSTATADNVESVFLGTGHTDDVDLSARKLKLDSDTDVAFEVLSSDDSAIKAVSSASTKHGMELVGGLTGDGLHAAGGAQGNGIEAVGGATAGYGINAYGQAANSIGIAAVGDGDYAGLYITGGVNGEGVRIVGGSTSGDGILITATDGDGISVGHGGSNYDIDADIHGTIDTVTTATDAETKLDTVIADTEDIQTQVGTAGAGLTDLGGMSTGMKAEAQVEANDALIANNLDHLMKTAVSDRDTMPEVVDDTVLANIMTKTDGDTSDFDHATDSLEANKDKLADIETDTGTTLDDKLDDIQGSGFSTATDSLVHIHDDHVTNITAAYGSAQKALIDGLPSGIAKGVELADFTFPMILSSDHETYATGKTLTEEISKDGGNYAACTNNASEIQSSGTYKITLTATEMNANIVAVRFTETDCDTTGITIITT